VDRSQLKAMVSSRGGGKLTDSVSCTLVILRVSSISSRLSVARRRTVEPDLPEHSFVQVVESVHSSLQGLVLSRESIEDDGIIGLNKHRDGS
jgi:hypothetical protein